MDSIRDIIVVSWQQLSSLQEHEMVVVTSGHSSSEQNCCHALTTLSLSAWHALFWHMLSHPSACSHWKPVWNSIPLPTTGDMFWQSLDVYCRSSWSLQSLQEPHSLPSQKQQLPNLLSMDRRMMRVTQLPHTTRRLNRIRENKKRKREMSARRLGKQQKNLIYQYLYVWNEMRREKWRHTYNFLHAVTCSFFSRFPCKTICRLLVVWFWASRLWFLLPLFLLAFQRVFTDGDIHWKGEKEDAFSTPNLCVQFVIL